MKQMNNRREEERKKEGRGKNEEGRMNETAEKVEKRKTTGRK